MTGVFAYAQQAQMDRLEDVGVASGGFAEGVAVAQVGAHGGAQFQQGGSVEVLQGTLQRNPGGDHGGQRAQKGGQFAGGQAGTTARAAGQLDFLFDALAAGPGDHFVERLRNGAGGHAFGQQQAGDATFAIANGCAHAPAGAVAQLGLIGVENLVEQVGGILIDDQGKATGAVISLYAQVAGRFDRADQGAARFQRAQATHGFVTVFRVEATVKADQVFADPRKRAGCRTHVGRGRRGRGSAWHDFGGGRGKHIGHPKSCFAVDVVAALKLTFLRNRLQPVGHTHAPKLSG